MSARTLTNVVNDQTVALNALIYGYAGHSLVTPHAALQQIWWTEERINEKVTKEFVTTRLQPHERERLTQPVGFGDLSDDTYIEWILEKARRLFLVLAEVGEADRIFAVVDKSWDDEDLPLQLDDIEQLALSNRRDNHANSRFYHTQFTFLLRELRDGVHIDYAPNEEVPLEYVMGLPAAVSLQQWSRVHLPKRPTEIYVRRRFALGNAESSDAFEQEFMLDVESARMVEHEHIAPVWASYTAKGTGYIVTNFVGQHTLRSFIDHREPTQYKKLAKPDRRWLTLNWLHCLSDAIATLHQNGFFHSAIRPTNIIIDERNAIAFSDIACLATFQKDKKPDPMDVYIYGAPEVHIDTTLFDFHGAAPSPNVPITKHASIISKSSSGSSNSSGSQRQKLTKPPAGDFSGFNFGFKKTKPTPKPRSRVHETEKADVFSLGCVFLEIVTFMLKKKPHEFVKHRSSKQKINTGGKNSRTDSSFHGNLDKIDTWIEMLEKAAYEHDDDAFRAIPPILGLIKAMLSRAPAIRPTARDVRDTILKIICDETSIPDIHCFAHKHDDIGIPPSSTDGSDGTSSVTSLRTMSTMSSSSDTDTIRMSTAPSTRAPSISDRSVTSDMTDDDGASIRTIEVPVRHFINTAYESPRKAPSPPVSPTSPRFLRSPTSPTFSNRLSSPSRPQSSANLKPWSKPFFRMP